MCSRRRRPQASPRRKPPQARSAREAEGADKITPAAAFRKLFDGTVPLISFGEAAPADKTGGKTKTASFAAPPGYEADPKSMEIHTKAVELQRTHKDLSYMDAVKQVGG
jgi:hypothetical protein